MDVKEFKLEISAIQLPCKATTLVTFTLILGSSCTTGSGFVRSFKKKLCHHQSFVVSSKIGFPVWRWNYLL